LQRNAGYVTAGGVIAASSVAGARIPFQLNIYFLYRFHEKLRTFEQENDRLDFYNVLYDYVMGFKGTSTQPNSLQCCYTSANAPQPPHSFLQRNIGYIAPVLGATVAYATSSFFQTQSIMIKLSYILWLYCERFPQYKNPGISIFLIGGLNFQSYLNLTIIIYRQEIQNMDYKMKDDIGNKWKYAENLINNNKTLKSSEERDFYENQRKIPEEGDSDLLRYIDEYYWMLTFLKNAAYIHHTEMKSEILSNFKNEFPQFAI
jgi:hypothetical protein